MGPNALAALPTAQSWYMNPYFAASFGAVVALGFISFMIGYFVFWRLRQGKVPLAVAGEATCGSCGLTGEMINRLVPCKDHSGVVKDIEGIKAWIKSHEEDYRRLAGRMDSFLDKGGR